MLEKNKGFTMLEMIIVVGIFTFIGAAMFGTLTTARRSWLTTQGSLNAQQRARIALERVSRELRLSTPSHVLVDSASNSWVRFDIPIDADGDGFLDTLVGTSSIIYGADDLQDVDTDGLRWERNWRIRYRIDTANRQVLREILDEANVIRYSLIVAQDVNPNVALSSFQTDTGNPIPTEAVTIALTTEIDAVLGTSIAPVQKTLRTRVNLRN